MKYRTKINTYNKLKELSVQFNLYSTVQVIKGYWLRVTTGKFVPTLIDRDIKLHLRLDGEYVLSMNPTDVGNHIRQYTPKQYIDESTMFSMTQYLTEFIESKYERYSDIEITYNRDNDNGNILIKLKLI